MNHERVFSGLEEEDWGAYVGAGVLEYGGVDVCIAGHLRRCGDSDQ